MTSLATDLAAAAAAAAAAGGNTPGSTTAATATATASGPAAAPSPGSALLSSSPSASVEPPAHPVREWMVIRPHITFLDELAARHFPSLFHADDGCGVSNTGANAVNADTAAAAAAAATESERGARDLAALEERIAETRALARACEEADNDAAEEKARALLKTLKNDKIALQARIGSSVCSAAGADATADAEPSPRVRAISNVVERLIDFCNREDRKTKKEIFRVIRCHNCSQSSTGGTKIGVRMALPPHQVEWMTNVRMGCQHSSVDKTMRILLEWYIAVIKSARDMEWTILQDTEAVRPDPGGFAMCLSAAHENNLHQRGRRKPGEAERALRGQFENSTTRILGPRGDEEVRKVVWRPETEGMQEMLYKLGRGC